MRKNVLVGATGLLAMGVVMGAHAAEKVDLHIKNHRFEPAEVTVPAGQKIRLVVHNDDPTPEEFESHSMKREKIIRGNSKAVIFVGPLEPGSYDFFGEFNMETAKGNLIAK